MAGSQISKDDIGTPHYYELLHQEAEFWERVNLGEVDTNETCQPYLAFTEIVAGHLHLGSPQREVKLVGWLRRLDDWLIQHRIVHGETYFLVAHKP